MAEEAVVMVEVAVAVVDSGCGGGGMGMDEVNDLRELKVFGPDDTLAAATSLESSDENIERFLSLLPPPPPKK